MAIHYGTQIIVSAPPRGLFREGILTAITPRPGTIHLSRCADQADLQDPRRPVHSSAHRSVDAPRKRIPPAGARLAAKRYQ